MKAVGVAAAIGVVVAMGLEPAVAAAPRARAAAPAAVARAPSAGLPPSLVAWASIASVDAVMGLVRTAGPRLGMAPDEAAAAPERAWREAEANARGMGVTTLAWLRRDRPIRLLLQDDGGAPGLAAGVLLLPMTSQAAVLQALPGAELGAEGHAAAFSPSDTDVRLYLDFLPDQVAITFAPQRWQSAAAVASGAMGQGPVPGLVSVGVSVANLMLQRPKEMQQLKDNLAKPQGLLANAVRGATEPAATVQQFIDETDRVELVLGADGHGLQVAFRMRAVADTAMDKVLRAGEGRDVAALARLLPAESYLAAISDVDPRPSMAQVPAQFRMLQEALLIPARQRAALLAQFTTLAQGLTGQTALAMYRDGDSALGMLALIGAREPLSYRQTAARFVGQLALLALDRDARGRGTRKTAAPRDPDKARIEAAARKGLARGSLKPLVDAVAAQAAQAGVQLSLSDSDERGLTCDALAIAVDWGKLAAGGGAPLEAGPALLGKGLTLAACSAPQGLLLAVGPSALVQARRLADGGAGGLSEAPSYRAALARAVPQPASLLIFDPVRAFATFEAAVAEQALREAWQRALAGAAPLSASYGSSGGAGEYRVDLPFDLLGAMRRGFKVIAEGVAERAADPAAAPEAVAPSPLPAGRPAGEPPGE